MADINQSIALTLRNEGGFVDNPNDKGGATNMGIEQRDLPDINIRDLTIAQAVAYYQENYWKPWMTKIPSQAVCNKIFDMSVLLGIGAAVRLLQRALGFSTSAQDGNYGPETENAVNEAGEGVLAPYKTALAAHFQWIAQQNTSQKIFLDGWLRRVNS